MIETTTTVRWVEQTLAGLPHLLRRLADRIERETPAGLTATEVRIGPEDGTQTYVQHAGMAPPDTWSVEVEYRGRGE